MKHKKNDAELLSEQVIEKQMTAQAKILDAMDEIRAANQAAESLVSTLKPNTAA